MEPIDLYRKIEHLLPLNETTRVFPALRQDPLVWNSLQRPDLLELALQGAGNQAACWNPGQLALLTLTDIRPEVYRAEPMIPLGQVLQERSLRMYQSVQRNATPPTTLAEAGLMALALRERRRLTGTWGGLLQEILPRSAQTDVLFHVWRTPLACLYSLVPDPEEMLRALMPKTLMRVPFDWVVLSQLAQPFSEADHCHIFTQVLKSFPVPYQLGALRRLSIHGYKNLAGQVAERLLIGHPAFSNLRVLTQASELDLASFANRALSLQQMATYHQLAGDTSQAASLFNSAEEVLQQWLAGLYLQNLSLGSDRAAGDTEVLINSGQLTHLAASAEWLKDEFGAAIFSHPYAASILDQMDDRNPSALVAIKRAILVHEKQPKLARDLARQASLTFLDQIRTEGVLNDSEFVYSWNPLEMLQSLVTLGLLEEVLNLAQALIVTRPTDVELMNFSAKLLERQGDINQAVSYQYSVVALTPNSVEHRRNLAKLWGKSANWLQAYTEWKKVIELSTAPELMDKQAYAQAAFEAGLFSEAMDISSHILQDDPNNGAALGVIGQSLLRQGDIGQAVGYLIRATLLSPEILPPWLALAEAQKADGEPQRALDTLRKAVTSLPEEPDALLALGKACDEVGLLAEGLPHFKKAHNLSPEDPAPALLYSQALRRLGHITESKLLLEGLHSKWKNNPELAYEYAQGLIDENNAEAALPILEEALRNGLPVLDGHLLYAKVLLGEFRSGNVENNSSKKSEKAAIGLRLSQAERALHRILQTDPGNLEARFLQADILREKGNLEEALAAYRQLADSTGPNRQDLTWRVQWGMAKAALLLGRTDTALAAYKEACQEKPENLVLKRELAEISLLADLPHEALEISSEVLQAAPEDVDNLAWYAGFSARLGENGRAAAALEKAVKIDPQRPDLMVDLAQWQMSAGDLEAARNTLDKVVTTEHPWRDRPSDAPRRNFMRQAAQMYLRMQDQASALACYEKALEDFSRPDGDLFFEVAELYERLGNYEGALDLTQKAQDLQNDSLPILILQSDLLNHLHRPQAAIASLERALKVCQGQEDQTEPALSPLCEIHERFTKLLLQAGDISSALYHAEKALGFQSANAKLAYQAADLALSMCQDNRANRIIVSMIPEDGSFVQEMNEQGEDGINLLCLQIETALNDQYDDDIHAWLDEALELTPYVPRLIAAHARFLARQGELPEAKRRYMEAVRLLNEDTQLQLNTQLVWLAETATVVRVWKDALEFAQRYAAWKPDEARSAILLAKTQIKAAEFQRLCNEVSCISNAPGNQILQEAFIKIYDGVMDTAARLANVGEFGRWQARGQAVFNPSAHAVQALAAMPSNSDDAAALILALRQLKNYPAAKQVSERFPESTLILLHLALCYHDENPMEGLAIAETAVQATPKDALAQAVLAKLAKKSCAYDRAIEAYTQALDLYPDEPEWHDLAGDLYLQIGKVQQTLWHRSQAIELVPEQPGYASKLGQAYLANGDTEKAIEFLEQSTMLDTQNGDTWLALASAYHVAGMLPQSMEAAKKASELSPATSEGLLIASETALAMNQLDTALSLVRDAIRREPENVTAYLFLCNVLTLKGLEAEALSAIESAPAQVRSVYPVAIERARLIYKVHGPRAALEVLEKLIKDYPEEPSLLSLIARAEADCGETKSAEKYAFQALKIDPNQPELTFMLGRIQRKSGQLDQAVHLLSEVIRMSPNMVEAYLELASVYQERREFLQALQVYRQTMRVAPNDFHSYYQSGLILRDSKDYASAEAMLRKAAELAPDNPSIRRQLVGVIALNLVHSNQEVTIQ